ncbi:hypothetical protein LguiB_011904 [Lonicera macranthoides]
MEVKEGGGQILGKYEVVVPISGIDEGLKISKKNEDSEKLEGCEFRSYSFYKYLPVVPPVVNLPALKSQNTKKEYNTTLRHIQQSALNNKVVTQVLGNSYQIPCVRSKPRYVHGVPLKLSIGANQYASNGTILRTSQVSIRDYESKHYHCEVSNSDTWAW